MISQKERQSVRPNSKLEQQQQAHEEEEKHHNEAVDIVVVNVLVAENGNYNQRQNEGLLMIMRHSRMQRAKEAMSGQAEEEEEWRVC